MKRLQFLALMLAVSACRGRGSPIVGMRPLTVPSPADAPCAELARDVRARGQILVLTGGGYAVDPDETLIVRRHPAALAGTVFPMALICVGHVDILPLELRMCVDGEHTFAVVSPASLQAAAATAARIGQCQLYDPSVTHYYANFFLRRGTRALIAGDR